MSRRNLGFFSMVLALLIAFTSLNYQRTLADDPPQENKAWSVSQNNLRASPTTKADVLQVIAPSTPVVLEGRSADTSWVLVHTVDSGVRGWGKTTLFKLAPGVKLYSLPVSNEEVKAGSRIPGAPSPTPITAVGKNAPENIDTGEVPAYTIGAPPLPEDLPTGAIKEPIVPTISPIIRSQMKSLVNVGKKNGNSTRVFSKVGDCHTDHPSYLNYIGLGQYSLGQYSYLQGTLNFFNTPVHPGGTTSFNMVSKAAHSAFSSGAVLDWQTADPGACGTKESPLRCELRINKPMVAVIDFGVVDVMVMTPERFNLYMRIIVADTMNRGVIPLMSTAAENAANIEKSRQFNQIIVKIAKEKHLPLMNLSAALQSLPNKGMDPDGIHLSRPADLTQTAVFTPDNLKYGYVMRNLLTLQALDAITRSGVLN